MIPSLTICLNNICNYSCKYCKKELKNNAIGENPLTTIGLLNDDGFIKIINMFLDQGVTVFRLTGGEPFLSPARVFSITELLSNKDGVSVIINTNGSLLKTDYINKLSTLKNLKLKISLDTLQNRRYREINGVNHLSKIKENLQEAVNKGINVEVNCVVIKENISEISNIWEYCRTFGLSLKLLDLYQRNSTYWKNNYIPLKKIEEALDIKGSILHTETLSSGRGIPMRVYYVNNNEGNSNKIKLTIKDMNSGTTYLYDCQSCIEFPCGEGIFTIILDEDGRLFLCHRVAQIAVEFKEDLASFSADISSIIKKYKNDFFYLKGKFDE